MIKQVFKVVIDTKQFSDEELNMIRSIVFLGGYLWDGYDADEIVIDKNFIDITKAIEAETIILKAIADILTEDI